MVLYTYGVYLYQNKEMERPVPEDWSVCPQQQGAVAQHCSVALFVATSSSSNSPGLHEVMNQVQAPSGTSQEQ